MINEMIKIGDKFQTSVNIAYDFKDKEKIAGLIPTKNAVQLLNKFILATDDNSTQRANVLVGAYGRGKSHIVLVILSILCSKMPGLYENLLAKVKEYDEDLYTYAQNYIKGNKKLLPVIINGSSNSLVQSFIGALYNTLKENELSDIMPETHFHAAVNTIKTWRNEYPETYIRFSKKINVSVEKFIEELNNFSVDYYNQFEELYPSLTSGSVFNPFAGFDVIELYEKVNEKLPALGYNGIIVVYDEFSKYLESSITSTSMNDIKMLQDFAEKCNRSGAKQLHLLLISHKEIANYIEKLPKEKVDGWRGVSERFRELNLENDFMQVYEVLDSAIMKETSLWKSFCKTHEAKFDALITKYGQSKLYAECDEKGLNYAIRGCYPMHPVTTFILPRLSEKVAQNERTMFTFIAATEKNTLKTIVEKTHADTLCITPDVLYDYFSSQLRNQPYNSDIYQYCKLANTILNSIDDYELAQKIIKTLALIYCLEQFERIAPNVDTIIDIYQDAGYSVDKIREAITYLTDNKFVVYIKRSNSYLKLKEYSGVDIFQSIKDTIERRRNNIDVKGILNSLNLHPYLYPTQYNDEYEMTRYFQFIFMDYQEFITVKDWNKRVKSYAADGVLFAVIIENEEDLKQFKNAILEDKNKCQKAFFVTLSKAKEIEDLAREFDALTILKEGCKDDIVLYDEYDIVYQDLLEVINVYISQYIRPELGKAVYFYEGEKKQLRRKANLSNLISEICRDVYTNTPVINNEVINKDEITSIAANSRAKLLSALLNIINEDNLGLSGSGQDVSFMRSTLKVTGILENINKDFNSIRHGIPQENRGLKHVLERIHEFFEKAKKGKVCFNEIYEELTDSDHGIGMRKGVIPIYIAVVLKEYKEHIVIDGQYGEEKLTAELLKQINENPNGFSITIDDWNASKQAYVDRLEETFVDTIIEGEKAYGGYKYLANAMGRWYLSLPRYTRESKEIYTGMTGKETFPKIAKEKIHFLNIVKQTSGNSNEIIFNSLPKNFRYDIEDTLNNKISEVKIFFDSMVHELEKVLIEDTICVFKKIYPNLQGSLGSILEDWYQVLPDESKVTLYPNAAEVLFNVAKLSTRDEYQILETMAKSVTGLRINDWNSNTPAEYCERLEKYVQTIFDFNIEDKSEDVEEIGDDSNYTIFFVDADGKKHKKIFERTECSKRAGVLSNEIQNALEEMGQSITPQEKRQVLIDILEKLC